MRPPPSTAGKVGGLQNLPRFKSGRPPPLIPGNPLAASGALGRLYFDCSCFFFCATSRALTRSVAVLMMCLMSLNCVDGRLL